MCIYVYIQIFESKYDHTNTKHGKGGAGGMVVLGFHIPIFQYFQHFSISTFASVYHQHFQHFNISLDIRDLTIQILNISTFQR